MQHHVELLKAERLKRGWTLQELSTRLHVNITVLKTLEGEKFESIGPPAVTDGLLRAYAALLGMDETTSAADDGAASGSESEPAERRPPKSGGGRSAAVSISIGCAIALFVLFVSLATWREIDPGTMKQGARTNVAGEHAEGTSDTAALSPDEGRQSQPPPEVQSQAEATGVERKSPVTSMVSPEAGLPRAEPAPPLQTGDDMQQQPEIRPDEVTLPQETPSPAEPPAAPVITNHHLEIQSDQKTWIQVIVDEGKPESELLQPGETREWKPREKVRVVVGNGGGVRIKWDGKPVETAGKPGRVVHLTIP